MAVQDEAVWLVQDEDSFAGLATEIGNMVGVK
jgi:hypothetical protein